MNNITIAGNLTKDAELRHMPDGKAVLVFSVADNQGKDKPAIFWNCSMFGDRGAKLAQYMLKGGKVCVSGVVTEREYTDKQTGQPKKAMDIRVADVALMGDGGGAKPAAQSAKPAASDDFNDSIPF